MMDLNLDFLKWSRADLPANDITRRLSPLIEQLFSRIFPHGVSQLQRGHGQDRLTLVWTTSTATSLTSSAQSMLNLLATQITRLSK